MVVYIAAQTGTALLLAASAFVAGVAAEREVLTSYHCRTPDVPTRVIKENSPTDFAVLFAAVQRGDCTYSPKRMSVTPRRFVIRIRSSDGNGRSFGYIWEIRLDDGKLAYWFFSKSMHKRTLRLTGA
jgi:hypothetical protein